MPSSIALGMSLDLHEIWVGTSDQQLMLSAGVRRVLPLRRYHGRGVRSRTSERRRGRMTVWPEFSEQHKQMGAQLLTAAATPERGFRHIVLAVMCRHSGPSLDESWSVCMKQWLLDLDALPSALRSQGPDPGYWISERGFRSPGRRIQQLAD